ncbi:hypothetical protein D1872_253920 [compost metagenome]
MEELLPAGPHFAFDLCRVVRSEHIFGNRAAIDKSTAGRLIPESLQFAFLAADIHGVLGNARILHHLIVQAKVRIVGGIVGCVALRVLEDERRFSGINIGSIFASGRESLVESGLVSAIGGSDHRRFKLHIRIGMDFQVLLGHVRNFIRKAPEIDGDFLAVALCGRLCRVRGWG